MWSKGIILLLLIISLSVQAQDIATLDSLRLQATSEADPEKRAMLYDEISYTWLDFNYDSAYKYARIGLSVSKRAHYPLGIRYHLTNLASVFDYQNLTDSAYYYYDQARSYCQSIGDSSGVAVAEFNLGTLFLIHGDLVKALESYQGAEKIYTKLGDEKNLSKLYNNLGLIYRKTEKYASAYSIYKKSLEIKERLGDRRGVSNTLTNLSSVLMQMDSLQAALKYSLQNVDLVLELKDSAAYAAELSNLGTIYKMQGDYDNSLSYFKQSEAIPKKGGLADYVVNVYSEMAEIYLSRGQLALSKNYLDKAADIAETENLPETRLKVYRLYTEYYAVLDEYARAFEYQEKYIAQKDKILNQQTLEKTTELEQQYESERKERQIAELELEKQTAALSIRQRENQRNISLSLAAILSLVAGFFIYFYLLKQKTNLLLEDKNQTIGKALADREVLLREIHHRVKNNLQIISSLLNLQARSVKDAEAIEAVKEGRNRVKSMALIHQKLYQEGQLTGISVRQYLESLCDSLYQSFGVNQENIELIMEADDLTLDVDTTIPLGLIVNELITNSLKYAFGDDGKGSLTVVFKQHSDHLILAVKDNGKGIEKATETSEESFGMKMVHSLARKLKALVEVFTNERGTEVRLTITNFKLVNG